MLIKLIKEFLDSNRIDKASTHKTIEAYKTDLIQFKNFLNKEILIQNINPENIGPVQSIHYGIVVNAGYLFGT